MHDGPRCKGGVFESYRTAGELFFAGLDDQGMCLVFRYSPEKGWAEMGAVGQAYRGCLPAMYDFPRRGVAVLHLAKPNGIELIELPSMKPVKLLEASWGDAQPRAIFCTAEEDSWTYLIDRGTDTLACRERGLALLELSVGPPSDGWGFDRFKKVFVGHNAHHYLTFNGTKWTKKAKVDRQICSSMCWEPTADKLLCLARNDQDVMAHKWSGRRWQETKPHLTYPGSGSRVVLGALLKGRLAAQDGADTWVTKRTIKEGGAFFCESQSSGEQQAPAAPSLRLTDKAELQPVGNSAPSLRLTDEAELQPVGDSVAVVSKNVERPKVFHLIDNGWVEHDLGVPQRRGDIDHEVAPARSSYLVLPGCVLMLDAFGMLWSAFGRESLVPLPQSYDLVQKRKFGGQPGARRLIYDAAFDRLVVFGGVRRKDCWTFDGKWKPFPNTPPSGPASMVSTPYGAFLLVKGTLWRCAQGEWERVEAQETKNHTLLYDPRRKALLSCGDYEISALEDGAWSLKGAVPGQSPVKSAKNTKGGLINILGSEDCLIFLGGKSSHTIALDSLGLREGALGQPAPDATERDPSSFPWLRPQESAARPPALDSPAKTLRWQGPTASLPSVDDFPGKPKSWKKYGQRAFFFKRGEMSQLDYRALVDDSSALPPDTKVLAVFPAHPEILPLGDYVGVMLFESYSLHRRPGRGQRNDFWDEGVYGVLLRGEGVPKAMVYAGGSKVRANELTPSWAHPHKLDKHSRVGGCPHFLQEELDPGEGWVFVGMVGDTTPTPHPDSGAWCYIWAHVESGRVRATFQV